MDTLDFFRARFSDLEEGETIEIRPIHATSGKHHPRKFAATVEEAAEYVARVPEGFEVYYGVNPRRGKGDGGKTGVSRIVAITADADDKHFGHDPQASHDAVLAFELIPTGMIRTGHGWHIYWLLAEPLDNTPANLDAIEALQRRLYLRLGGLDSTQDISRVLRVPGTTNWKDPQRPLPVTVDYWETGRAYTPEDFEKYLPPLLKPEVTYRETTAVLGDDERPSRALLRTLLGHIDPRLPYAEYVLIWAAVAYYYPGDDGLSLVDEWSSEARAAGGQYSSARTQPEKHAGFKRQTGRVATLGTLIHYAKLGGYVVPQTPLNVVSIGKRGQRKAEDDLADLPNPTVDELPHFLQRMYDHLGPLTAGLPRDLITVTSLTAFSILWPNIRFENLPLSLFLNLVMEQGSGKSVVTEELERLFRLVLGDSIGYYTGGSPQGVYQALNKSSGKSLYASIDEFGDFLSVLKQEYMSGARGNLNSLYDGRAVNYQRSRDAITIENPHVTLIGTTTPKVFLENVTDQDLEGGFASRFWYLAPWWENQGRQGAPTQAARLALANEITEHVAGLQHITQARFDTPTGIAHPAYAEYELRCGVGTGERRGIYDALNDPQNPKGRHLARVKRVAPNLELLDIRPRINGNTVIVRDSYLRLAIVFVRRTEAYANMILSLLAATQDQRELGKLRRVLARRPEGVTRADLLQLAHIRAQDLSRLLPLLEEADEAEQVQHGNKTLWRVPGVGLRLVHHAAD